MPNPIDLEDLILLWVSFFGLVPAHRHRGIGSALVHYVVRQAAQMGVKHAHALAILSCFLVRLQISLHSGVLG